MKKLTLNREFLLRHLGVAALMFGLAIWFGYDGYVVYPQTDAAALYESIEKSAPSAGTDVEAFKAQKIKRQYEFALLCLLAGAAIGLHVWALACFRFAFDETGFVWNGKKRAYAEITAVDRSQWGKGRKGILAFTIGGRKVKLDAWHHVGVADFEKMI